MQQLEKFNIDKVASDGVTSKDIEAFLNGNRDGFIFQKVIERARHYSDLTFSYLEASYICEKVAELGETDSFEIDWQSGHHPMAQFKFLLFKIEELQDILSAFVCSLRGETEEDEMDWLDVIEDYRDNLRSTKPRFPELVDDYYANLVEGEYYQHANEVDDPKEYLANIKINYPEHAFGFWICSQSNILQQEFYVSTESWIIPPESNLDLILKEYSAIDENELLLENASFFSLNGEFYVINESYVVKISYPALLKAFQCIAHVYLDELTYHDQHNWIYHLSSNLDIGVSDFANFVKFNYNGYSVLLWNQYKLTFNDITLLNRNAEAIFKITSDLIGLKEVISCNWSQLSDESFEELCYDIIYYDPRYDNTTIRKMGKSRSRDGGRDLEVYTQARLGYTSEKFIFQCKLLKPGTSLTATKVLDISDTIERYEANGYGIFTSGVIDPTLFDKIDAIAKRKHIKTELSSSYELERLLARLPKLKSRHFKSDKDG